MATYSPPLHPHVYEAEYTAVASDSYEQYRDIHYCQHAHSEHSHTSPYYYGPSDLPTSFTGTHGVNGVLVANNQTPLSHPYYADANLAVMPYPSEYTTQSGDEWVQPNHSHSHKHYGFPGHAHQPRPLCESGEVSPASDDSGGPFYDSPHSTDQARLVDDSNYVGPYYEQVPPALAISTDPEVCKQHYTSDLAHASPLTYEDNEPSLHGFAGTFGQYDGQAVAAHHARHVYQTGGSSGDYEERRSPARYGLERHNSAPVQPPVRAPSPMAHLPYHELESYGGSPEHCVADVFPPSPSCSVASSDKPYAVERPQPVYPVSYNAASYPNYPPHIAIPASRSPPLVEDTPKKPLTLACFFCRKRKIACGSPPPGKKDRTCNQCARRNLQCVYPVNSRRGARQRELEAIANSSYSAPLSV